MNETSSTQHLCVPSNNLASNYYSDGDISFPVPQLRSKTSGEELLDPRLISETVRRSLLALHRESQENVNMLKKRDKTRSETDVHGVLIPLKTKLKSVQQQFRPHSNTLMMLSERISNTEEHTHHLLESAIPMKNPSLSTAPMLRRSLKHYPKYATQSTSESESTQPDSIIMTNTFKSIDDDEVTKTVT